jgi:hypothetical protein
MSTSATASNFDYKPIEAPKMGFYYKNTAGSYIGYETATGRLNVVSSPASATVFTISNYLS